MYQHICTTEIKKARKEYNCDSCYLIQNEIHNGSSLFERLTDEEKEAIEEARIDKWKIKIGTPYTKIVGAYDGDMQVTKNRPEILAIVYKYRLYSED